MSVKDAAHTVQGISGRPGEPQIELLGAKTGNCLRVSIALEEASLPYVVRQIDLQQGEQRSVAHLALNPVGKVPVIIDRSDDGRAFVLSQSNAILLYVADKAPGKLLPLDNLRRALVLERFFYFITDVISISHAAFQLRRDGGDSTFLDRTTLARLEFAEHYFSDARFVAGNDFSLADIAAFSIAFAFQEKLDWRRLPRLGRWFQEVAERETVQRGLRAFDCVPTA